ncbi:hypothetical protein X975_15965, partial [Stegodyphus mimosarum]
MFHRLDNRSLYHVLHLTPVTQVQYFNRLLADVKTNRLNFGF